MDMSTISRKDPTVARRIPPLRRHKRKGRKDQAYVTYDGKRTYFGRWGTPEANAAYKQFVAQWEVDSVGDRKPRPKSNGE